MVVVEVVVVVVEVVVVRVNEVVVVVSNVAVITDVVDVPVTKNILAVKVVPVRYKRLETMIVLKECLCGEIIELTTSCTSIILALNRKENNCLYKYC